MQSVSVRTFLVGLLVSGVASLAGPRSVLGQAASAAPDDAAQATLIRQLLDRTRAAEMAVTAIEAALLAQRAAHPMIPREFWDEFAVRARREMPRFIEQLVPIYAAHFSTAQLQELVAFYESPLGRHLADVQPRVTAESMQAGQQFGAALGAEIAQDLARKGAPVPGS